MSNFYHETGYVCPFCGTSVKVCEFTETDEHTSPPFLFCPKCRKQNYRCDVDERFIVQRFSEYRAKVFAMHELLMAEAEALKRGSSL